MLPLRTYIGFDHRAHVAAHVCYQSIFARASVPVANTVLVLPQLPITRTGLTTFTWSRFLVPYLQGYQGLALFLDSDIILQADIAELFALAAKDMTKAVWVVDYQNPQLRFERAAVMLFNCSHPDNAVLTPDYIETTNDSLHKISWTQNIGSLPEEWGHLVMYQPPKHAKLIHYTAGIPAWEETKILGYANEWFEEANRMGSIVPYLDLMGNSVHHKHVMQAWEQYRAQQNAKALAEAEAKVKEQQADDGVALQPAAAVSSS